MVKKTAIIKSKGGGGKILIIVESPGKITKLQEALGPNYIVMASVGHVIDLPEEKLAVDVENKFEPEYAPMKGKEKVIMDLKKAEKISSEVILASDLDREGEMIAWSLAYILNLKNYKRIVFNNTTKETIKRAIENPIGINQNYVDSQKARRILDRLIGYEVSPILWKNIGKGAKSAGRVQSVVVRLIVDKENEITEFFKKNEGSYFKFFGKFFDKKKNQFSANLFNTNQKTLEDEPEDLEKDDKNDDNEEDDKKDKKKKKEIEKEEEIGILKKGNVALLKDANSAKNLMKLLNKETFIFSGSIDKESIRNPSAPFTTASMQQEAIRKLGFTTKRTMDSAQKLYEEGHITYMRTDSVELSAEALKDIEKYITYEYGKENHRKINYKSKSNNTQEAHEAIRPTHIEIKGLNMEGKIGNDEVRLYNLIWKRSVASQMVPAKFKVRSVQISPTKTKEILTYYFQTKTEELIFPGYLLVYNIGGDDNTGSDIMLEMPKIGSTIECSCLEGNEDYKKPPLRYNEGTLNKKIDPDHLNIGRPSTTASIINKIQQREYVIKKDIEGVEKDSLRLCWNRGDVKIKEENKKIYLGKETNKFIPTSMGKVVTNFLVEYFKDIMDYKFTADMEKDLDKIAEGEKKWYKVLEGFYKDFHKIVEKLGETKIKYTDKDAKVLGKNPKTKNKIITTLKKHGDVVMEVEDLEDNKEKIINIAPIKLPLTANSITLEEALELLSYPKLLGKYGRKEVWLKRGKYGLYASYGDETISFKDVDYKKESDLTIEKVIEIIEQKIKENNEKFVWQGKNGKVSYVVLKSKFETGTKYFIAETDEAKNPTKKRNAPLPDDIDPKTLTVEKAKEIVDNNMKNRFSKGRFNKKTDNTTTVKGETGIKRKPKTKK